MHVWPRRGLLGAVWVLCAACVLPFRSKQGTAPAPDALGADAGPAAQAVLEAPPVSEAESAPAPPPSTFPDYAGHPDDAEPVDIGLENIEGLDYYYGKLTLTELGHAGAITRASHWGDSVIGGDGLTEAIRQRLQQRFGDAGHGFHAMGKYNRWYGHRGVRYEERSKWDTCLIIFKCRSEQRYGYAGVSSISRGRAQSRWRTTTEGFGQQVSRFELWYEKRPDGGGFEIRVDGQAERVVDSRAPVASDAVEIVRVPDGPHEFQVTALGSGVAHAYGVVLERDVPGAVWDELSMIGSFTQRLDYQDPEHAIAQVKHRDVDLLVFMFGGNDLMRENTDLKHSMERYEAEYARVIRKLHAGKPEASCMIMTLTDHAKRVNGVIVSRPMVGRLVAAQRLVASREGCAFFDTFAAMGGLGAIERGRKAKPALAAPDLRHPTLAGQRRIGTLLYGAMMKGYASYRRRQVGQPLPGRLK